MSVKQKVLIVDDEPRNQRIAAETIEDVAEISIASTGEEALSMIESGHAELVLLDVMMPGIDGYEVCRRLRADPRFLLTKIILVSGKAMIDERLKGYEAGADGYITKPFVPDELLAKCKVFLKLARVERELVELNQSLDKKVQERTQQLLQAESRIVSSAKMSALGEMAGGIAHEINTPLATIGLLAEHLEELLNDEPLDRKTCREMTATVGQTVRRISKIIQGLRTFSRDGSQDRFDSVPLRQVVESTMSLCKEKLRHGAVQLVVEPFGDEVRIQCRPVQISQVLLNLVSNACDAIQPLQEKWIKISVKTEEASVRIFVTDSGGGIPPSVRDRLFQPFFTTKEIGKGTGIGLSISKGIMDAHRGSLRLDENSPNTCFVLTIGAGAAPGASAAAMS